MNNYAEWPISEKILYSQFVIIDAFMCTVHHFNDS